MAFKARERRLPYRLGELVPEFISDTSLLVCPLARASGDYSSGRDGFYDTFEGDPTTTYIYEFFIDPEKESPDAHNTGRAAKENVRLTPVGDKVPLFTCLKHLRSTKNRVNFAYDGTAYTTGDYWECLFREVMPFPYLSAPLLGQKGPLSKLPPRQRVAPRLPNTPDACLDLSAAYTAIAGDPWLDAYENITFSPKFEAGLQQIGGISFDARAIAQLNGRSMEDKRNGFPRPYYPDAAPAIDYGHPATALNFLHATAFSSPTGEAVGTYTVHYADGGIPPTTIPIRMGREIGAWRSARPPALAPAWEVSEERSDHSQRLFVYRWENPHPETAIASVVFETDLEQPGAPFLLAITAE